MILPVWRLVRRRWLTAIAGLLLAAAMCVAVGAYVQPEHRATGQMMFLLPPEQPDPTDPAVNPYLNLPDGMSTTANLIAGLVTTEDVSRSLAGQGLVADYTVGLVPGSGPVLAFDVVAADPETALATRNALMTMVEEELASLQEQADTPANQVMTTTRPTVSRTAETLNAPVYRAIGATAGVGIGIALLLCLLVDRLMVFGTARKERARAEIAADVTAEAKGRSRRWRTSKDRGNGTTAEPEPADTSTPEVEDDLASSGAGVPGIEADAGDRHQSAGVRTTMRRRRDRLARRHQTAALDRNALIARDGDGDGPRKLAG